ncbi:aromatic prenyltransferase [Aspergillus homomorphus CBS 101889]|uniref:Aromatic prenyltransferase n=1 Tax=Aspergillus homomorphus (strain CBS 101889) TaxID=1450537 RepID=A0A395HZE8_ASPHC|nr:aromatic prenyltransferase [Aspergillus homomorphus CBS 101889]RAL13170.1 aromatic prenyltransferase [Aspergillus homomorphus CBS 101889]
MAYSIYQLDHDLRVFLLLLGTPILYSLFLIFRVFVIPPAVTKSVRTRASERALPSAWRTVNEELDTSLDCHGQFWWRRTGILLAELLHDAEYTQDRQRDVLRLFGGGAVPFLGLERESGAPGWKSFMTDDHHPIELSWDWHTGQQAPTVRFSIEPVSRAAATMKDPENWSGDRQFRQVLPRILPAMNTQWLRHFDQALSPAVPPEGFMEGHPSKIFYAFDLEEADQTGKVYYFPGFEARATHQTNLDVLVRAIQTAPRCSDSAPHHLSAALGLFQAFVRDPSTAPLELDMMAIDLVDPAQSRIKIYFRSRETSFASVRRTMSLGGKVSDPWLQPGLRNLKRLWDNVLDQGDVPEEGALRGTTSTHRTAGMLYNVEFRLGSETPKVKIYIPVRHYARSDWQVFTGLREYLRGGEANGQASASIPHYGRALGTILTSALENQTGIHTYIGCSVQRGGELRVVSYINGQTDKFRPEWGASN